MKPHLKHLTSFLQSCRYRGTHVKSVVNSAVLSADVKYGHICNLRLSSSETLAPSSAGAMRDAAAP